MAALYVDQRPETLLMPTKTFVVVRLTDMPREVRVAVRNHYDHHITISNGVYVPFNNWQNTEEGSCETGLLIERWMEANVPELAGLRASDVDVDTPVLIHADW